MDFGEEIRGFEMEKIWFLWLVLMQESSGQCEDGCFVFDSGEADGERGGDGEGSSGAGEATASTAAVDGARLLR